MYFNTKNYLKNNRYHTTSILNSIMRNSCPNEPWEVASQPVGGLNTRESRLSEVVMSIVIGDSPLQKQI
jgi:hypothetical protein